MDECIISVSWFQGREKHEELLREPLKQAKPGLKGGDPVRFLYACPLRVVKKQNEAAGITIARHSSHPPLLVPWNNSLGRWYAAARARATPKQLLWNWEAVVLPATPATLCRQGCHSPSHLLSWNGCKREPGAPLVGILPRPEAAGYYRCRGG